MNLFDFAPYYSLKKGTRIYRKVKEGDHSIPYSEAFAFIKNSTRSIRKRFFLLRI